MEANSDLFWGIKKKISFWKRIFQNKKTVNKVLTTPEIINENCKGILFGTKYLKSFLFSTDMALIENNDSDAILAVYPFPPSAKIMKSLIDFSEKPVICGVGGGVTKGKKSLEMAIYAEEIGAAGIIVNVPFENKDLKKLKEKISIPIIASVATADFSILKSKIDAGVNAFHVTAGMDTNTILKDIIIKFPEFPVMATGGNTLSSIEETIAAGSAAIVLSPPSNKDLFKNVMKKYRNNFRHF